MKNYKVIQDYPDSPFFKGDILKWDGVVYGTGKPQQFVREPDKYPHLFKLMH